MVVEDSYFDQKPSQLHMWKDETAWATDEDTGRRVPAEVQAMLNVRIKLGSEYIVKLLNWKMVEKMKMYRLYLELCPYGELFDILDHEKETPKPEPFLWHLFECLAIAGSLMSHGDEDTIDDWKVIIHRDLKVENVFMSAADPERYCR